MTELDPRFLHGIELFNKREFYDCHEILEAYWNTQQEPEKQLTQGIIQIAVAYYHVLRGNRAGAEKLLKRGIPRVQKFLPAFKTLDLQSLVTAVEADLEAISSGEDISSLRIPQLPGSAGFQPASSS